MPEYAWVHNSLKAEANCGNKEIPDRFVDNKLEIYDTGEKVGTCWYCGEAVSYLLKDVVIP
jgi:hypothetical protein